VSWKVNEKLKIGNIELDNNIICAPMAGITDLPFRLLCKEYSAGLVYIEMISSKGLSYGDKKTRKLLDKDDSQGILSVQIFGSDVFSMTESAKIAVDLGADIIDINIGCPVRKITKTGAGAKLLENEKLIADILYDVVKSSNIPVTVKTRLGLTKEQNIASRMIEICQDCGIKAIAIHCRYASQGHSGEPDIAALAKACIVSKIPVIANGGIFDCDIAKQFFDIPNCKGLMIGRGAIANYSIFKRLNTFLKDGEIIPSPNSKDKIDWLKRHYAYAKNYYKDKKALLLLRKTISYYTKDFPNASKIRNAFNKIETESDFLSLIDDIYNMLS
jgi:tRNA-dihydrouridine synthase B